MSPVRFAVSAETAFDYLADPANRAAWQSSLLRVEDVSGPVAVGQSWVDVTAARVRPRMETTELDRPHRWSERGTWRAFSAVLTLTFTPVGPDACDVGVDMRLQGRGLARPLAALLGLVSPRAVRGDLRRAAALLADPA